MTEDSGRSAPTRVERLVAGAHAVASTLGIGGPGAVARWLPAPDELLLALAAGDLSVHVRPRMSLADGRTVGAEALLRWEHPSRGMLTARDIVPMADAAGLHARLTEAVVDLALAGATRWWSHRAPLPVAVALAAVDVADAGLPATVGAALARHLLPPRALVIAIREQVLVDGPRGTHAALAELRALGVAVSVDGYGTDPGTLVGLRGLRGLPADQLTLDPALVADVAADPRVASAVRRTAGVAHALGLRVVADGVADTATLGALAGLGCDAVAGPVVAGAMPVETFVRWLADRPADRPVTLGSVRSRSGALALPAVGTG